jgi:steroid delta-isomerase-like uncharacterized protein
MSEQVNKAIVRRVYQEILSKGNFEVIDLFFHERYVYHEPGTPEVHGPDGIRQLLLAYRTALPDMSAELEDMVSEGDKVAHRFTIRGTHRGDLLGVPATGKQVEFTGILISQFDDGKIIEEWENLDTLGLLQQIGAVAVSEDGTD